MFGSTEECACLVSHRIIRAHHRRLGRFDYLTLKLCTCSMYLHTNYETEIHQLIGIYRSNTHTTLTHAHCTSTSIDNCHLKQKPKCHEEAATNHLSSTFNIHLLRHQNWGFSPKRRKTILGWLNVFNSYVNIFSSSQVLLLVLRIHDVDDAPWAKQRTRCHRNFGMPNDQIDQAHMLYHNL